LIPLPTPFTSVPPGADANSKLPVMFWIFGGGYQIGTVHLLRE
jgi:carboxylesterase type B